MGKVARAFLPLAAQAVGYAIGGVVGAIVATVIATALVMALTPKFRGPGIKTEQVLTGGTNGRTFILGRYATAGAKVCPDMSHGKGGKLKNGYLMKVTALSDKPVTKLNRLIVNGEYVAVSGGVFDEQHRVLTGKYQSNGWVSFHDGTQTAADNELIANYSNFPARPWLTTSIGKGVAYAAVTFKYDADLHKSEPALRFELDGIALYDPRKDSSIGGSGAHRWGNESTYEFSCNSVVMIYNILRGIAFLDGTAWGGNCAFEDLPLSNWVAGMNVCDETVGGQPRYRAGFEIDITTEEPADIIEELLKSCSGDMTEDGGVYTVRVGPPSLPVMFVSDHDFLVNREQEYDPFPSITDSKNTLNAIFPHPEEMWEQHDAPAVSDQAYIDQDDGQVLTADIKLPTVPYPEQVQRLMLAWLKDDRRWRRHVLTIGHFGFALQPLDVIAWTSVRNGYVDKYFEINATTVNLFTLNNTLAMREVDPADYDWSEDDLLPDPVAPGTWELPESQSVEGFAVTASSVQDSAGVSRRPALLVSWAGDGAEDAHLLKIQVRVIATQVMVSEMTVTNLADGQVLISEGILPATSYEARAQYVVDRPVEWTDWLSVTTGNILLTQQDVDFDTSLQKVGESQLLPELSKPIENRLINRIIDVAHVDLNEAAAKATHIASMAKSYEGIALVVSEANTRLDDDVALAQRIDTVGVSVSGLSATVQTEINTRIDADTALGQRIDTVVIDLGDDIEAAVYAESVVRFDQDGLLATSISQVSSRLNNFGGSGKTAEAVVSDEQIARVDGDEILAGDINTITVRLDDFRNEGTNLEASVYNERQARINGDGLLAEDITQVSVRLDSAGGDGVTVEQAFTAQGSSITNLNAKYTVRINNNGIVSGFGLASGAGGTSEFAILADRFVVADPANNSTLTYPFQVVGGVVYMRSTVIQDASITSAKIGNLEVKSANIENLTIGTEKIADLAATNFYFSTGASGGDTGASGPQTIATVVYNHTSGFAEVKFSVNAWFNPAGAGRGYLEVFRVQNGISTAIPGTRSYIFLSSQGAKALSFGFDQPSSGSVTYELRVIWTVNGLISWDEPALSATHYKK